MDDMYAFDQSALDDDEWLQFFNLDPDDPAQPDIDTSDRTVTASGIDFLLTEYFQSMPNDTSAELVAPLPGGQTCADSQAQGLIFTNNPATAIDLRNGSHPEEAEDAGLRANFEQAIQAVQLGYKRKALEADGDQDGSRSRGFNKFRIEMPTKFKRKSSGPVSKRVRLKRSEGRPCLRCKFDKGKVSYSWDTSVHLANQPKVFTGPDLCFMYSERRGSKKSCVYCLSTRQSLEI